MNIYRDLLYLKFNIAFYKIKLKLLKLSVYGKN